MDEHRRFDPMKNLVLLVVWVAFTIAQVFEIESVDDILGNEFTLLYFYAPDCKYCNEFNPDFAYLAELYSHNQNLNFGKTNGRSNKELADLFKVNKFPTIKLYDAHKKKVAHFEKERSTTHLKDFITTYTKLYPDEGNVVSNIELVSSLKELNDIVEHNEEVVLAFATRQSPEWKRFHYSDHFYQKIAALERSRKFVLVLADENGSDILEEYHVSNFPSIVMLTPKSIRAFNTLSTNVITNHLLDEDKVTQFLNLSQELEETFSFGSLQELKDFVESREYDGHKQVKPGMNIHNVGSIASKSTDEEYEDLLYHIEL